jgi:hypothetical protein
VKKPRRIIAVAAEGFQSPQIGEVGHFNFRERKWPDRLTGSCDFIEQSEKSRRVGRRFIGWPSIDPADDEPDRKPGTSVFLDAVSQGSSGGRLAGRLIRLRIIRIVNAPKDTANVSRDHWPNVSNPASDIDAITNIIQA